MKPTIGAIAFLLGSAAAAWCAPENGFELRLEGGLVSPVSNGLYQVFQTSSSFGLAAGYHFGKVSLLADTQFQTLNPISSNGYFFYAWEWALVEKAAFGASTSIKPFAFLGEGVVMSNLSVSTSWETDPMVEAGVGMDFFAADNLSIFLQSKAVLAFTSNQATSPDQLSIYLPFQVGMDFNP